MPSPPLTGGLICLCPGGTSEKSPPFQRWVTGFKIPTSPAGAAEPGERYKPLLSSLPGLAWHFQRIPPMNRWAIFIHPDGLPPAHSFCCPGQFHLRRRDKRRVWQRRNEVIPESYKPKSVSIVTNTCRACAHAGPRSKVSFFQDAFTDPFMCAVSLCMDNGNALVGWCDWRKETGFEEFKGGGEIEAGDPDVLVHSESGLLFA